MTLVGPSARCQQRQNLALPNARRGTLHPSREKERNIFSEEVWNGFLLGKAKKEDVPCRFCGKRNGDGHLFWECTFSPSSM